MAEDSNNSVDDYFDKIKQINERNDGDGLWGEAKSEAQLNDSQKAKEELQNKRLEGNRITSEGTPNSENRLNKQTKKRFEKLVQDDIDTPRKLLEHMDEGGFGSVKNLVGALLERPSESKRNKIEKALEKKRENAEVLDYVSKSRLKYDTDPELRSYLSESADIEKHLLHFAAGLISGGISGDDKEFRRELDTIRRKWDQVYAQIQSFDEELDEPFSAHEVLNVGPPPEQMSIWARLFRRR